MEVADSDAGFVVEAEGDVSGVRLIEERLAIHLSPARFADAGGAGIDAGFRAAEGGEELFRHIVYRNYHFLSFPNGSVATELRRHPWELTHSLLEALERLRDGVGVRDDNGRHDELVEFAYQMLEAEQRQELLHAG